VLLEAGAAGLPIVTTQMPGCSDLISDGWNGFLVPPRSAERLAARIIDLLQDRNAAQVMGARASQLVRRDYNLDVIVARYAALYAELMDRPNRLDVAAPMQADQQISNRVMRAGKPMREQEIASWRTGT
jgi:hypothetical protein